jgi:hypothetical protein
MPQVFVYRSQAADYAKKQGWSSFRTKADEHGMWFAHYEPGQSPAEAFVQAIKPDYVAWTETEWDRSGESPVKVGVIVVSCRLDEIPDSHKLALIDQHILTEPQTPSLWAKGEDKPEPAGKAKRTPSTGVRAKSDVASPTKLVWEIADSMPGATRKDIIAACVAKGVHPSTASTQFSKWNRAKNV